MKPISIITAAIVCIVLYFAVVERETLLSFATGGEPEEASIPVDTAAEQQETAEEVAAQTASAEAAAQGDDDSAVPVVAERSTAEVIDSAVVLRGRTEAARRVDVRSETTGLVISSPTEKGAEVNEGDILCELDIGTRESTLAEAQSRLEEARARLTDAEVNERAASRLSQDGFASETRVTAAKAATQSARASIQSADAAIAAAQKEIDRTKIRAPFSGVLESDTAESGTLLQPGASCATVLQLDPITLVGFVPETEVDRIALGAPAGGRLTSGREVTGTVTFLSRSADPNTRTFRVEVEADNTDGTILDGQTVEIVIASDGATAHLVPQSALTLDNDGDLGLRLVGDGDVATFAPITILRDTTEGAWVAGLPEEVAVIVVGQEYVTDGVAVVPTYREASR